MFFQCWSNVCDARPAVKNRANVLYLAERKLRALTGAAGVAAAAAFIPRFF